MHRLEMEPNSENIFKSLKENKLGRNGYVFQMVDLLNSVNDAYSISIDAPWGSGKTFFVKQVAMVLNALNDYDERLSQEQADEIIKILNSSTDHQINLQEGNPYKDQLCVYYNAWNHDRDEDPVSSIIVSIIRELNLKDLVKDRNILRDLEMLVGGIIDNAPRISLSKVLEKAKGESLFTVLYEENKVEEKIHKFLDQVLYIKRLDGKKKIGDRLVIFIDDLDRCQPKYAINLLERIKHYFCHKNITFVFSVNREQLVHTIKREYGDDFEAERYLDRFFDNAVTLPTVFPKWLYALTKVDRLPDLLKLFAVEAIDYYSLQLREILKFSEFISIAALELHTNDSEMLEQMEYPFEFTQKFCTHLIPIMAALRLTNMQQYGLFINGKNPKPFIDIFKQINYKHNNYLLRFLSINSEDSGDEEVEKIARSIYEAIFNNENSYDTKIGKLEFNKDSKQDLLARFSLLRKDCNYYPENFERGE